MTDSVIVKLPLRDQERADRYDFNRLLRDGSLEIEGSELHDLLVELESIEPVSGLLHPEVRYEVTDHCNANCIMCPREEHKHGREHGVMDGGKFKVSIDEVKKLGAQKIVLTGFGEPMLDKGLEEKIRYAKEKGLHTYIITNGSILTGKRAAGILEAGLDEIRISFYGMGAETYNAVMQGLEYQKTHDGIISFLGMRDRINPDARVQLSYLVLPENEVHTETFKEYWEPKVEALEIWKPHNFGDGRSYRDRRIGEAEKESCGRPENGPLQIQWNGEVVPCCYDYNNKIVLGNAFEQPVMEILNSPKYRLLRYAHEKKRFGIFPFCDQCDQLLPHADALIYTNRHNLPPEEAVRLSNTDLYDLVNAKDIDEKNLSSKYIHSEES